MNLLLQCKLSTACLTPKCREREKTKLLECDVSAGWMKEQSMENECRAANAQSQVSDLQDLQEKPAQVRHSTEITGIGSI